MSNLWSHARAGEAASVGSFAIERRASYFTPWASEGEGAAASADLDPQAAGAQLYAQGFEEGFRSAEEQIAADREALAKMLETLDALQPEPTNALALLLAETVDRLVRQICGTVEIDAAVLTARAQAAAALIGAETEPAQLRLHPDDVPLIDPARIRVRLVADDTLERGSLVLETGQGWIEDGPAVRLDRLRAELDRIGASS